MHVPRWVKPLNRLPRCLKNHQPGGCFLSPERVKVKEETDGKGNKKKRIMAVTENPLCHCGPFVSLLNNYFIAAHRSRAVVSEWIPPHVLKPVRITVNQNARIQHYQMDSVNHWPSHLNHQGATYSRYTIHIMFPLGDHTHRGHYKLSRLLGCKFQPSVINP